MELETKPFYRSVQFWAIVVSGLIVLGLGIYLVVALSRTPVVQLPATTSAMQTTAPASTPPTLPPPPANPYTQKDFATSGQYLTCLAGTSTLGIDVSEWQGEIDWQQVKSAGVEFVILRLGWRGSEQGVLQEDSNVQTYYTGAKEAGLQIGGYFFSQAVTTKEAIEEAELALEITKDWQLDMPLVFDWEHVQDDYRTAAVDARRLTDMTHAFCQTIRQAGHTPMVYFNPSQAQSRLYLEELTDYEFWLAMYDHPMDYPYKVDFWQYTATGTVPGINGPVDLNLYFTYENEEEM